MARLPRLGMVIADRMIDDEARHQRRQSLARWRWQRPPFRRRCRAATAPRGEQIELLRSTPTVVPKLPLAPHGPLPDSDRERPLLLPKQEHSMMRAHSRRHRSHRAMPATIEARRYPPAGRSQRASARKPPDRTSKSAVPTSDPTRRRHGCSGPHRPPPSRSPHEYEQRILPTDAKDKGPCAPRSYGRCLVALYNRRRPHSSLDGTTPDQAYFAPLPIRMAA
jgi:hypothetical protein